MQKALKIWMSGLLFSGVVFAEPDSVEKIMNDLSAYSAEGSAVDRDEAPAADESSDSVEWQAGIESDEVPAAAGSSEPAEPSGVEADDVPVAQEPSAAPADESVEWQAGFVAEPVAETETPAGEVDWDAEMEASRALFAQGEFVQAQKGFEKILNALPENKTAALYLRCLRERDHRHARDAQLSAVDAAWETEVVLRSYPLSAAACRKMALTDVQEVTDVRALFPQVSFPEGTSALFQPKRRILFVRNTLENFEVIEATLDALNILKDESDVEQIEIETRFVEVSDGALEELGFQWNFNDPVGVGADGTDLDIYDGPGGLFADGLRGSPSGSSPALPFSRVNELGDTETRAAAGAWNAFRFADTFNQFPADLRLQYQGSDPVELFISALDQQSGTDVLSAPRVLVEDGETAVIRVGERHSFPEVYEVDADEGNIAHVVYQDFEEKLLGVELQVTPAVKEENIILELNPKIMELVSWQNYQVAPEDSVYSYYQYHTTKLFDHDPIVARLPVLKKRAIETIVTIADGSTIGMGGLINERTEAFEDSVPLLGRIPLVGRLFRNEGERTVKRNLLMFVTAKRIQPNGRANTSYSFE